MFLNRASVNVQHSCYNDSVLVHDTCSLAEVEWKVDLKPSSLNLHVLLEHSGSLLHEFRNDVAQQAHHRSENLHEVINGAIQILHIHNGVTLIHDLLHYSDKVAIESIDVNGNSIKGVRLQALINKLLSFVNNDLQGFAQLLQDHVQALQVPDKIHNLVKEGLHCIS